MWQPLWANLYSNAQVQAKAQAEAEARRKAEEEARRVAAAQQVKPDKAALAKMASPQFPLPDLPDATPPTSTVYMS